MIKSPSIINLKIAQWENSSDHNISFSGIDFDEFIILFHDTLIKSGQKTALIVPSDEDIYQIEKYLDFYHVSHCSFYSLSNPYYSIIQNERDLIDKLTALDKVSTGDAQVCLIAANSICDKLPPVEFFKNALTIQKGETLDNELLKEELDQLGYNESITVEEPGSYAIKGEIFDVFPLTGQPARIIFFDDEVESIYPIDIETQVSIKDNELEKISLSQAPAKLCSSENIMLLREALPSIQPQFKERQQTKNKIFEQLSSGKMFENYTSYFSLFFKQTVSILELIDKHYRLIVFSPDVVSREINSFLEAISEAFDFEAQNIHNTSVHPLPQSLFSFKEEQNLENKRKINIFPLQSGDHQNNLNNIHLSIQKSREAIVANSGTQMVNKKTFIDFLEKSKNSLETIFYAAADEKSLDRAWEELKHYDEKNIINNFKKIIAPPIPGFYYPNGKFLYVHDYDFVKTPRTTHSRKTKKKFEKDLFAEQIASLQIGDFVIHQNYGVGKYLGLETLERNQHQSDFIVIEYKGGDKVYVPVYKLDLVQKYSDSSSNASLADLNTKKFDAAKSKAKKSIKKLAFDLLELQAKRGAAKGYQFQQNNDLYLEFEKSFPYQETADQLQAIDDVIADMESEKVMDRLVCGDVGFGKTEVAIRAAYKAVLDNKQVVLLVPTTILALQHYNGFCKRFKNYPVTVEHLSRFRTAQESKTIKQKIKQGKVDIIIGTHRLLASDVEYFDLGLVIVDEEHRFGVGHKEKMKLLKTNVDFLTMTATPIPRTLQLSFLGIRDMSIIQTPPPNRQTIKSYIVKDDDLILKKALDYELARSGQIFIVHNRVQDIENIAARIKKLVPSSKITIAHGQMSEKILEQKMDDFYSQKSDILISTTIIESGIDIPNANTMIIFHAENFGLAQLHQLRGRIGRSNKKAYAYFVIPQHKKLTAVAGKRLKALQTYSEMGAGFSLASSDLEIRGAGDILGAEQSGHISSIGLELYIDLLQDALNEIKGQPQTNTKDIEISTTFEINIPARYIKSPADRLKYYKKLSNAKDSETIQRYASELNDIFGAYPKEVESLINVFESKLLLRNIGIKSIKVLQKKVLIKFDKETVEANNATRDKLINYFMSNLGFYRLSQDFSVEILNAITDSHQLFELCQKLKRDLAL